VEAIKSSIPMIVMTSDIPFTSRSTICLQGFDQLHSSPFVKESLTANRGDDIPFLVRRAFRVAQSGLSRPGSPEAAHVRTGSKR
jgi:acetolactate synthase-1/2/3 large subunit